MFHQLALQGNGAQISFVERHFLIRKRLRRHRQLLLGLPQIDQRGFEVGVEDIAFVLRLCILDLQRVQLGGAGAELICVRGFLSLERKQRSVLIGDLRVRLSARLPGPLSARFRASAPEPSPGSGSSWRRVSLESSSWMLAWVFLPRLRKISQVKNHPTIRPTTNAMSR